MNTVIDYAAPYSTSREIYKVIIHEYDDYKKLLWTFEVWGSRESIEDELKIEHAITRTDLEKFAKQVYEQYLDDWGSPPKHGGVRFSNANGIQPGDPNTFPHSLPENKTLIQTNVSLPKNLHEVIKAIAALDNTSMSEIIRTSLTQYSKKSFICSTCNKNKHGDPQIEYDGKKDCRVCFLRKFEES